MFSLYINYISMSVRDRDETEVKLIDVSLEVHLVKHDVQNN